MTNREWLLNKMQNMSDEELYDFEISQFICDCHSDAKCNYENYDCPECKIKWLKSEHKEKITLLEAERIILENIDKDYKWIARDEDGSLVLHSEEPQKEYMCNTWMNDGAEHDILSPFDHLFRFIKWEDEEAYNIEELLKEG